MDPRYQWPPPGYPNAQYGAPPPPNGYPQHGYHPQYQPAPMQMQYGYPQSQPMQGHPQMAIPPPNPQYTPMPSSMPPQPQPQPPRTMHPQVMIPARNPNSIPHMQAQNQRIRQVQVPVPRTGSGVTQGGVMAGQSRPNVPQQQQQQQQQVQSQPMPKPMQQSQSFQENTPRSQQRVSTTPVQNHSQHRSPLQPHSTPQSRPPPQPQTPSTQFRNQSVSGPSSQVKSHPQVVIPKSSSQQSTPQKSPHSQHKMYPQVRPTQTPQSVQKAQAAQPAPSNALPADLAVMLLSAADEYISAARTLGGVGTGKPKDVDVRQYYKLMATAMGCMETVLKKFNQAPRDEAKLRLRYASLLIEETENNDEIEKVLTQGIAHCARGRLQDLKYAMTHLQARYQFKSNHRAALKSLDKSIQEAETFQHIVWVYAFRFLKVSLALQAPGRPETSSALQQLHAIASHAERRGDRAIYVTAHALEALAHFRSTTPDRLDNVQRAIAAARSQQLQMSPKQLGSIAALVDIVDIACGLQLGRANPEKINALGDLLDNMDKAKGIEDGVFSVLIERSIGGNLTTDTGGIFRKAEDKRDKLVLSWLPKDGLKLLGNYVGGLDRMYHEKGLVYLKAGIQDALIVPSSSRGSITTSLTQMNWLKVLSWHMTFAFGVIACYRQDYWTARSALSMLKEQIEQPPFSKLPAYTRTLSYLSAVIEQSSGSLSAALSLYSSSIFSLPDGVSTADAQLDLSVLATMNRLLIIRDPNHAEHYLAGPLFAQLDQLCSKHPNETMSVALRLLRALTNPDPSINRQKTMLHITNQAAHQVAQKTDNWQLSIMCLSCITSTFYGDTVGEQPVKGARAVRMVSKRSGSLLWTAVAYGLCISIFEHNGMLQDANACRQAYEEIRDRLPPDLSGEEDLDADGDIDM